MRSLITVLAVFGALSQAAYPCDRCDNPRHRLEYYGPQPVTASAVDEMPGRFAYWRAIINANGTSAGGGRSNTELTGYSTPVVSDSLYRNGSLNVQFVFYDKDGNVIKTLRRTGRPERTDPWDDHRPYDDYWRPGYPDYSRTGYITQGYSQAPAVFSQAAGLPSAADLPWPRGVVDFRLSGSGPWTIELAAGSNLPPGQIVSHEWDFNHDGDFGLDTGRSPSVSRKLNKAGKYIFSVRVTDLRGYSSTAEVEVVVPAAQ